MDPALDTNLGHLLSPSVIGVMLESSYVYRIHRIYFGHLSQTPYSWI